MIFDLENHPTKPPKGGVIALGCFDGIHLGHQKIISAMKAQTREKNLKSALYIFYPHPLQVLNPSRPFQRLFTLEELKHIFKSYKLDFLGLISFSKDFSRLSPEEFVRAFIVPQFQPDTLVVGYDFSFGRDRSGRISDLKALGKEVNFEVIQIPAQILDGKPVSTSRIKKALSLGQTKEACRLSGKPFFFFAPVVKGEGRGKGLGYPTANLSLSKDKLLPKTGVYSAQAGLKGRPGVPAVLNIGYKPTFGFSKKLTVEVHIINNPVGDLYGQTLKVEIGSFIREERPFKNSVALRKQIQKDVQIALNNFLL